MSLTTGHLDTVILSDTTAISHHTWLLLFLKSYPAPQFLPFAWPWDDNDGITEFYQPPRFSARSRFSMSWVKIRNPCIRCNKLQKNTIVTKTLFLTKLELGSPEVILKPCLQAPSCREKSAKSLFENPHP